MPIASPQQFREMLTRAREDGFAYPAVNVTSSQTLNAALRGFCDARSDGIVQITTGAAEYLSGPAQKMAAGAIAFAELAHVLGAHAPVLIALHTDHCVPAHVDDFLRPLFAETRRRRALGRPPLFNSHMFDGSTLPLAENLAISADLLGEANALDLLLELEIGVVGGEEDGIDGRTANRSRLYSTPADARAVVAALGRGRGRYLLAATFGNVHGRYAPGHVELRPELLGELQSAVGDDDFDFVFHGGSGSTAAEIATAIRNGVVKMNLDTDMQYAFTAAIAGHVLAHAESLGAGAEAGVDKTLYDPRAWGRKAEVAMAARVVGVCETLGSVGSADGTGPRAGRRARSSAR
jgi:fructose-bisphosphate aldolase, class II